MVGVLRAKGMTSEEISEILNITPEHVRAYYFKHLNSLNFDDIEKLLKMSDDECKNIDNLTNELV